MNYYPEPFHTVESRSNLKIGVIPKMLFALLVAGLAAAEQPSIENARALLAKGELKEAAVVLRQVVAADPGNVNARTLLGTTLSLQGSAVNL